MACVLLVRHGETTQTSSLRYWGKTDVELSAEGILQAEQLRDRLAGEKIDFIFSSQLQRAVRTASIIGERHPCDIVKVPELNEIDFGDIEGMIYQDVTRQYPGIACMWQNRDPELQYPNGESLFDMGERVNIFKKKLSEYPEDATLLVVAHSGIIRTLICHLLEIDQSLRWKFRIELASLSIIKTYPETAIMSLLNDISHLKE